jgi:hypothetical protein
MDYPLKGLRRFFDALIQPVLEWFSCVGAVAQLGERRVRNAKVGSSILLRSTKNFKQNKVLRLQM